MKKIIITLFLFYFCLKLSAQNNIYCNYDTEPITAPINITPLLFDLIFHDEFNTTTLDKIWQYGPNSWIHYPNQFDSSTII
jgi:hypothetical protein